MAYSQAVDVSSIRYIVGVFVQEVGHKIATAQPGEPINLDDEVLHMDALCSHWLEDDEKFLHEWGLIQKDRISNEKYGEEDPQRNPDVSFRYREWRAQLRAAIRCGLLYKVEPPRTTWDPKEMATP